LDWRDQQRYFTVTSIMGLRRLPTGNGSVAKNTGLYCSDAAPRREEASGLEEVEGSDAITAFDPADGGAHPVTKYYVDDVEVAVATGRVQYLDASGNLITESLRDYSRRTVRKAYSSLDTFLTARNGAERKQAIIEELTRQGVFLDELAEQVGNEYDAFDLVCHVAFDEPPLTRRERAERVTKRHVFANYGEQTRAVLQALLDKYADGDVRSVKSLDILKLDPLRAFGTPVEIVKLFGGANRITSLPFANWKYSFIRPPHNSCLTFLT
jgi:type I restriction enzyme R subunit